jgi:hypothetical protein
MPTHQNRATPDPKPYTPPPAQFEPPRSTEFDPPPATADREVHDERVSGRRDLADPNAPAPDGTDDIAYSRIEPGPTPASVRTTPGDPVVVDAEDLRRREEVLREREEKVRQWVEAQHEASSKLTDRDVEGMVIAEYAMNGFDAFKDQNNMDDVAERALRCTTIVALVLRNGFTIIGTGVVAAPELYDANEGKKEARSEALAKLWLCAEYAHRQRLMGLDMPEMPDDLKTPREREEERRARERADRQHDLDPV